MRRAFGVPLLLALVAGIVAPAGAIETSDAPGAPGAARIEVARIEVARIGLAQGAETPNADEIAAIAERIVSQRRYTEEIEGAGFLLLHWLTETEFGQWIARTVRRVLDWLLPDRFDLPDFDRGVLNSVRPSYLVVVLVALAIGGLLVGILLGRRRRDGDDDAVGTAMWPEMEGADAETLAARADAAEADGDLASAVRLRFMAGLLTLDDLDVIEFKPAVRTAAFRSELADGTFDRVADDFERVTYSTRGATTDDVTSSKSGWTSIVGRARTGVQAAQVEDGGELGTSDD